MFSIFLWALGILGQQEFAFGFCGSIIIIIIIIIINVIIIIIIKEYFKCRAVKKETSRALYRS